MEPNEDQTPARKRKPRLKTHRSHAEGFDKLPDEALTDQRMVEALFGVSPATVWRMVKAGALPAPLKLTARSCRWRAGDLRRLIAAGGPA